MSNHRIYKLDAAGRIAYRLDLPADVDASDALKTARRLAADCAVELWRGSNLLATFRPETPS
jgi:hypothetical protein